MSCYIKQDSIDNLTSSQEISRCLADCDEISCSTCVGGIIGDSIVKSIVGWSYLILILVGVGFLALLGSTCLGLLVLNRVLVMLNSCC
jgi:hypothetical protein